MSLVIISFKNPLNLLEADVAQIQKAFVGPQKNCLARHRAFEYVNNGQKVNKDAICIWYE